MLKKIKIFTTRFVLNIISLSDNLVKNSTAYNYFQLNKVI